jgi:hypothetical protein
MKENHMGMTARACLAYGYDLGTGEDFKADQRGEYDGPDLPWYDEDEQDDDEGERGFVEQLFNHLYSLIPNPAPAEYDFQRQQVAERHYGVQVEHSGSHDYPGWLLVIKGSERNVEWSDVMTLNVTEMECRPDEEGWDEKLTAALNALGITPTQPTAAWLVYPTYG